MSHRPTLKELGVLSHSACVLYEWLAYAEYARKFYGDGTRAVVSINEDWDSEFGSAYAVSTVEIYDGATLLQPNREILTALAGYPIESEEDAYEFLDDHIADLPVPFALGDVHSGDEVEIDLLNIPPLAMEALKIQVED